MATLPSETPVTPLRQRMLDDMRMRAMRSRTQHDYVRHVRAFDDLRSLFEIVLYIGHSARVPHL